MTNQDDVHRAFIYFHCRDDWHYQFLAGDLKTPLPLNYHFTSSNMVAEPVKRGGGVTDRENRSMLYLAIMKGRGRFSSN